MKRATSEKIAELEDAKKKAEKKAEQYKARIARVQAQLNQEQRRARTHRLIMVGAELERLVGREVAPEEVEGLLNLADHHHDPDGTC